MLPYSDEVVEIVGREPPVASRRARHLDKPAIRPFANGMGVCAYVVGGLPYVQHSFVPISLNLLA